jgi:hypothetical protein
MPDGGKGVSASVSARRKHGRDARQGFYDEELGGPLLHNGIPLAFADSFEELIAQHPKGLPPSLQSKMAVIYLDGNKCTAIREKVVFGPGGTPAEVRKRQKAFSEFMRSARRKLLKTLLEHLLRATDLILDKKAKGDALRFETLLWGGDESLVVVPAWALMDALPVLHGALDDGDWKHNGFKISHAAGILICNYKTPISVAKRLAQELADAAKPLAKSGGRDLKTLANVLSIQIMESVEPPREDLAGFRTEYYGTGDAAAFTLVDGQIAGIRDKVRTFKASKGGLPRSQLFGLLAKARDEGLLKAGKPTDAQKFLDGAVQTVFTRCKCAPLFTALKLPDLGYTAAAPLLPLIRLAELWDYVDPLVPS